MATDDRIQRAVEETLTAHTESAAAGTVANNSAAFEGRTVSKGNVAAVEILADNWRPPGESAENN